MKIYIEDDNGNRIECREIKTIGQGDLLIISQLAMRQENIEEWEEKLSAKLNRKVVILPSMFGEVYGLPPS